MAQALKWPIILVFAFSLGLIVITTAYGSTLSLLIPAALLVALVFGFVVSHPLAVLSTVIIGFYLISSHGDGQLLQQAFYGTVLYGYLASWSIKNVVIEERRIVSTLADYLLLVFFLLVGTVSLIASFLYGADPGALISEGTTLSILLLYFPVREAVRRDENALKYITFSFIFLALLIAFRNIFHYQSLLLSASELWQIARGRVVSNEALILAAFAISLVYFGKTTRKGLLLWLPILMTFSGALIVSQSRSYWVAMVLTFLLIVLFAPRPTKVRLLLFAVASMFILFVGGHIVFGNAFWILVEGITMRVGTLAEGTGDVSFTARSYENLALMNRITSNPILGHGMGSPFTFADILDKGHETTSFVHNGYYSAFFKFGIWGALCLYLIWMLSIFHCYRASTLLDRTSVERGIVIAIMGVLAASLLTNITSNIFILSNGTFSLAVMWGVAGGVKQRADDSSL